MNTHTVSYSYDRIADIVCAHLVPLTRTHRIITFQGPLGAGKTTMIKEFLLQLGVIDDVTSPTFTYVNVYHTNARRPVYHFDLYRLDHVDEFIEAGFDEYLRDREALVLIEWSEVIESLLERDEFCHAVMQVCLQYADDAMGNERAMTISRCTEQP